MKAGRPLRGVRKRKELSQENVAHDLYISKQLVSHMENDRRTLSEELAKKSVSYFGEARYGYEIAHEIAADFIPPLATANKGIEWHRLALEETFKVQASEAIEILDKISLAKHPSFIDEEEKRSIELAVKELLDVQLILSSFLSKLEHAYPISVKDCMRKRLPNWKVMGWIE
ncbi:helix-turn-helix transcriptional regulator [Gracilibacillus alcaliphilus]|uniref:helix-turn-helix transcriptional regulator n=1 Tax=Gracilibacillus alcaliphilus TaxID=1401441 RepID=UPI0023BAFC88|nr:helix-turn-helix transcriptional regulator [Gracilibacillus alcaliphilus]